MHKFIYLFIASIGFMYSTYGQISSVNNAGRGGEVCSNKKKVFYSVDNEQPTSCSQQGVVAFYEWEISPSTAGTFKEVITTPDVSCFAQTVEVEWDLDQVAKGGVELKATVSYGSVDQNSSNPCSSGITSCGTSYSHNLLITLAPSPTVSGGVISGPSEITTANDVTFSFSASTQQNVEGYVWRISKGTQETVIDDNSMSVTPAFTYLDNGTYTLTCTPVSDCGGGASASTKTFTVNIPIPVEYQPCQDITTDEIVTLAPSADAVYLIVGEGCELSVESCTGVVISDDVVLEDGAVISASIGGCEVPNSPTDDLNRHWTLSRAFDENEQVIGESKHFFDALGRPTQSQVKNLTEQQVLATEIVYDLRGQGSLSTLVAPINNRSFAYREGFLLSQGGQPYTAEDFDTRARRDDPRPVADYIAGTVGYYYGQYNQAETHVPTTAYPFARSWTPATPDPTVSISSGPGEAHRMGSGHEIVSKRTQLSNDPVLAHYYALRPHFVSSTAARSRTADGYRMVTTDANGRQSVGYVDAGGRAVVSGVENEAGEFDYRYVYYDDAGRMVASIAPRGVDPSSTAYPTFVNLHEYDGWGRLIRSTSPDQGSSEYVYSHDGKLRFSQSSEQRAPSDGSAPRFSYTHYDAQHRLLESGEYVMGPGSAYRFEGHLTQRPSENSVLSIADLSGEAGDVDEASKQHVQRLYYDLPSADFPPDALHAGQQFLYGRLSKSENHNSSSYYSYDVYGRLDWMVQELVGLGRKTIDYHYDLQGKVVEVAYQAGQPDAFHHYYGYDADQRLREVHTSRDGQEKRLQATYHYYLHGPLKRVELADELQGIDYVYTIQGALKSINAADQGQDPGKDGDDVFGMSLHYYSGDYVGVCNEAGEVANFGVAEQYGGALQAISWHSPAEEHQRKAYTYEYDAKYQLVNSTWGEVGWQADGQYVFSKTESFAESILGYDAHGNIEGLQRTDRAGALVANFGHYQYQAGTNQLTAIKTSVEAPINLRSYAYNRTGQLLHEQKGQAHQYLSYDAYGRVIGVYGDAQKTRPVARYGYNDQGQRMLKKSYNEQGEATKDTWYVRDASGTVMSIYEEEIKTGEPLVQVELPVYGSSRLGMLSTRGSDEVYQYELTDHLGNVRAVISRDRKADGSVDVLHYQDYYAFGSVIKDNQRKLGSYRYGYQGQYSEQDEETAWNSFELRQYDGETGRWLSVDPYGQYASPYVAMGNNPVNTVDPSGGWGVGTTLAVAGAGAAAGYGIDRALGGDGRTGFFIGLIAGSTLGNLGYANDWTIKLPKLNWSAIGKTTVRSVVPRTINTVSVLRQNTNRLNNVRLPDRELAQVPAPRARPQLLNPTGQGIRNDAGGQGHFGAPRGRRTHEGIDFAANVGQDIVSSVAGRVRNFVGTRSGYPMLQIFPDDPNAGFDYIEILYVDAPAGVEQWEFRDVAAGDPIGTAANLQNLGYPQAVTPHIHVQVWSGGQRIDPTPFFFAP